MVPEGVGVLLSVGAAEEVVFMESAGTGRGLLMD